MDKSIKNLIKILEEYADIHATSESSEEGQALDAKAFEIKAQLEDRYKPFKKIDPKKPSTFMISKNNVRTALIPITTKSYDNWVSGKGIRDSSKKIIAKALEVPVEMLDFGPTECKIRNLINRNYTNIKHLCKILNITQEQLLQGLEGDNDIVEQKLEEFAQYFQAPVDWLKSARNPDGKGEVKRFYYTLNQFEKESGWNRRRLDFIKSFLDCKYGVHSTYEEIGTGTYHYKCKKSMLDIAVKILGVFKAEKIKEIPTSDIEVLVKEYGEPSGCFMILDDDMVTVWETYDRVKNDYIHHILLQLDYEPLPELKPIIE